MRTRDECSKNALVDLLLCLQAYPALSTMHTRFGQLIEVLGDQAVEGLP